MESTPIAEYTVEGEEKKLSYHLLENAGVIYKGWGGVRARVAHMSIH
jgi:hypothetical protein